MRTKTRHDEWHHTVFTIVSGGWGIDAGGLLKFLIFVKAKIPIISLNVVKVKPSGKKIDYRSNPQTLFLFVFLERKNAGMGCQKN